MTKAERGFMQDPAQGRRARQAVGDQRQQRLMEIVACRAGNSMSITLPTCIGVPADSR